MYCGACTLTAAKLTVLIQSQIKGKEAIFHKTPRREHVLLTESTIKEYKTTTSRHYNYVLI